MAPAPSLTTSSTSASPDSRRLATAATTATSWPYPPGFHPRTPRYSLAMRAEIQGVWANLRSCMVANGVVDFPDISRSYGDGHTVGPLLNIEWSQHASDACAGQLEAERQSAMKANGKTP